MLVSALLSQFSSDYERETAAEKILEIRKIKRKSKSKKIRIFVPPTLNELDFGAQNLIKLIKWPKLKKFKLTEGPLIKHLLDNEIRSLGKGNCPEIRKKIAQLLCHSQYCEQFVNMVSRTVSKFVSHEDQKTSIIVTKESQEEIPVLCTKEEFRLSRARRKLNM